MKEERKKERKKKRYFKEISTIRTVIPVPVTAFVFEIVLPFLYYFFWVRFLVSSRTMMLLVIIYIYYLYVFYIVVKSYTTISITFLIKKNNYINKGCVWVV